MDPGPGTVSGIIHSVSIVALQKSETPINNTDDENTSSKSSGSEKPSDENDTTGAQLLKSSHKSKEFLINGLSKKENDVYVVLNRG